MNFSVVFDIESWTRVAALIMAKAPCHGRVTFNLSQSRFYLELSQRRVRQPLRVRSLRILATNETRIVDESGFVGGVPGDGFETFPASTDYTHGACPRAERSASRCTVTHWLVRRSAPRSVSQITQWRRSRKRSAAAATAATPVMSLTNMDYVIRGNDSRRT